MVRVQSSLGTVCLVGHHLQMNEEALHTLLAEAVLRTRVQNTIHDDAPCSIKIDKYLFQGKVYERGRILLKGLGCCIRTCTMCPLPNQGSGLEASVAVERDISYCRQAFSILGTAGIIAIYNNGSFFADCELSPEGRRRIYELLRSTSCQILMIESLPKFITKEKLEEFAAYLPNRRLIVGMGLQSSNRTIRELCALSPVREEDFLDAFNLLRESGFSTKAYALLKPPFLNEHEAYEDCVSTIHWLKNVGIPDITLCPTLVSAGTIVGDLYRRELYFPPRLTTVIKILYMLCSENIKVRVPLFATETSGCMISEPAGCCKCRERIVRAINKYNVSDESAPLAGFECADCELEATANEAHEFFSLPLNERIEYYLKLMA